MFASLISHREIGQRVRAVLQLGQPLGKPCDLRRVA